MESTRLLMQDKGTDSIGDEAVKFELNHLVERHYRPLYQFALSLTRSEADAFDLTQHTFYTWQIKGEQLRDLSKVRTWLFTTLHRAFLQVKRRETRFHHHELGEVDSELPWISPHDSSNLDAADVLQALVKVDPTFRAPLALFYLEECPYKEIALILNIPLGTVKSRIARGIVQLQKLLGVQQYREESVAA
jgi:RNA polymerase sigma-70 factor (ECF subfamily)